MSVNPAGASVAQAVNASFLPDNPEHLIGDGAYDSDPLDPMLAAGGIEMIAPHRRTRVNITQDGRPTRDSGYLRLALPMAEELERD